MNTKIWIRWSTDTGRETTIISFDHLSVGGDNIIMAMVDLNWVALEELNMAAFQEQFNSNQP